MLARRQVRLAALAALQAAQATQSPVPTLDCPGDWATAPESLPAWRLRVKRDHKVGKAKAPPVFDTTCFLEVEARLTATTAEAAQDQIEAMGDVIENALFCNQPLVALIEEFTSVDTELEVTADARQHFGSFRMILECQLFESFEPATASLPALQGVDIHADLQNVFDPAGTYSNPPFPDSVVPAPRTTGPDGRDEGAASIDLPQS